MNKQDLKPFSALLAEVSATYGRPSSEGQVSMFFGVLADYSFSEVRCAMLEHMRDPEKGRFMPLPADLIARMSGGLVNDGRPGDEEAWAISRKAGDELDTVVWTEEMRQAFGICRPVLEAGDEIGARMAFKQSYARLVSEARARRELAAWSCSLGDDKERRVIAIERAVKDGRISQFAAAGLLPAPKIEISGLLGSSSASDSEKKKAAENCRRLLEMLKAPLRDDDSQKIDEKEIERRRKSAAGLAGILMPNEPYDFDDDIPF